MRKQSPKTKQTRKAKKSDCAPPDNFNKNHIPPDVARALIKFNKDSKEAEASILRSIYG